MLNDQGYVAECTGDNIFLIIKGELFTPPFSAGALKGITRQTAIEIADELGVKIHQGNMTRYDVWNAEECFLTGTAAEVIPVVEVDGRIIGSGRPGEITNRFIQNFRKRVATDGIQV